MAYSISEENQKITEFLKVHPVASLATASTSGVPHVATVYVNIDDSLNLYFITKAETTKTHNILANPQVALSITDAKELKTVQVTGSAQKVVDNAIAQQILTKVTNIVHATTESTVPPIDKLVAGDYVAFVVHPSSIRLAEFIKPNVSENEGLFDVVVIPES